MQSSRHSSVVDTNPVGSSGVHRITFGYTAYCAPLFPTQIPQFSSHRARRRGEERKRGVYWGGKSGLRKYLASTVLARHQADRYMGEKLAFHHWGAWVLKVRDDVHFCLRISFVKKYEANCTSIKNRCECMGIRCVPSGLVC